MKHFANITTVEELKSLYKEKAVYGLDETAVGRHGVCRLAVTGHDVGEVATCSKNVVYPVLSPIRILEKFPLAVRVFCQSSTVTA